MTATRTNPQLAEYEADLLNGKVFDRIAAAGRSVIGYRPPAEARTYARLVQSLTWAVTDDQTAKLVSVALAGISPATTPELMAAGAASAVAKAVRAGFTDVIGKAGPEAGRPSDHEHAYTLRPLVEVCAAIQYGSSDFIGYGWTLAALIEKTHARVQQKSDA